MTGFAAILTQARLTANADQEQPLRGRALALAKTPYIHGLTELLELQISRLQGRRC
jgi:hypothetical protein